MSFLAKLKRFFSTACAYAAHREPDDEPEVREIRAPFEWGVQHRYSGTFLPVLLDDNDTILAFASHGYRTEADAQGVVDFLNSQLVQPEESAA